MKFVEKNGRVWPSKKAYKLYKSNVSKYFWGSLALECYADATGDNSVYQDEGFKILNYIRTNSKMMNTNELLEMSNKIVEHFEILYDKIGRELFSFDEHICYIGEYKMPSKNENS